MILLIDNYDSFVYNLRRYLTRLGQEVLVLRNDAAELSSVLSDRRLARHGLPSALVLSPGPGHPSQAGGCVGLVRRFSGRIPILGVCLGHQAICEAFGGQVVRAPRPMHGRSCPIDLLPSRMFHQMSGRVALARYHSLVAEPGSLPAELQVTAWSEDRQVMAVEHVRHATFGWQFHPESILSSASGYRLLSHFLSLAGLAVPTALPSPDLCNLADLQVWQASVSDHGREVAEHAVVLPSLST